LGQAVLILALAVPHLASAQPEWWASPYGLLYVPGVREAAFGGAGVASAGGHSATYLNPALPAWRGAKMASSVAYSRMPEYGFVDKPSMFHGGFSLAAQGVHYSVAWTEYLAESGRYGRFGVPTTYGVRAYGIGVSDKIGDYAVGATFRYFVDDPIAVFPDGPLLKTYGGWCVDLGTAFPLWEGLMLGIALRNYGPDVGHGEDWFYGSASEVSNELTYPTPTSFRIGFEGRVLDEELHRIVIVVDLVKSLVPKTDFEWDGETLSEKRSPWYQAPLTSWFDEGLADELRQIDVLGGVESTYNDRVHVRVGGFYDRDGKRSGITLGCGFGRPFGVEGLTAGIAYVKSIPKRDGFDDGRISFGLELTQGGAGMPDIEP